jgi:hypothetical protein
VAEAAIEDREWVELADRVDALGRSNTRLRRREQGVRLLREADRVGPTLAAEDGEVLPGGIGHHPEGGQAGRLHPGAAEEGNLTGAGSGGGGERVGGGEGAAADSWARWRSEEAGQGQEQGPPPGKAGGAYGEVEAA